MASTRDPERDLTRRPADPAGPVHDPDSARATGDSTVPPEPPAGANDAGRPTNTRSRETASGVTADSPGPPGPVPAVPHPDWPVVPGYEIVEKLAQGGMGQVFKARQVALGRLVALKVIRREFLRDAESVRRFQREARAAARLSHPHVVTVFDAGHAGEVHYLAMEYVEGTDLGRLVREHGPLPVGRACRLIGQAALGLEHLADHGLVHRDVKPGNLLLASASGAVKISDMGLVRMHETDPGEGPLSELTELGSIMGTLDYMAPEQACDPRAADIRADLYALGCTLHFLLTGRPPFPGNSMPDKLLKHKVEEPPSVVAGRADVPPELDAVVRRLLAKQAEERYQRPVELVKALEPFLSLGEPDEPAGERRAGSCPGIDLYALTWAVPGAAPYAQARKTARPLIGRAVRFFPAGGRLVAGLLGVAVVVLLLLWLYRPPRPGTHDRGAPLLPEEPHPTMADSWVSELEQFATKGDWKEALERIGLLKKHFPERLAQVAELRDKVLKRADRRIDELIDKIAGRKDSTLLYHEAMGLCDALQKCDEQKARDLTRRVNEASGIGDEASSAVQPSSRPDEVYEAAPSKAKPPQPDSEKPRPRKSDASGRRR